GSSTAETESTPPSTQLTTLADLLVCMHDVIKLVEFNEVHLLNSGYGQRNWTWLELQLCNSNPKPIVLLRTLSFFKLPGGIITYATSIVTSMIGT
ncbi:unnamed protein product, partial [Nesidiocoris tenuis]